MNRFNRAIKKIASMFVLKQDQEGLSANQRKRLAKRASYLRRQNRAGVKLSRQAFSRPVRAARKNFVRCERIGATA